MAGFALRRCLALLVQPVPKAPFGPGAGGLTARLSLADEIPWALPPAACAGAEAWVIHHLAGFADPEQIGADDLHLFALPEPVVSSGAEASLRFQGFRRAWVQGHRS